MRINCIPFSNVDKSKVDKGHMLLEKWDSVFLSESEGYHCAGLNKYENLACITCPCRHLTHNPRFLCYFSVGIEDIQNQDRK